MTELFVPGRICLFGEHSDWAGGYRRTHPQIEAGYTLICGANQGLYARASADPHALVLRATTHTGETRRRTLSLDPAALAAEAQAGGFWSYVAGTAWQIVQRYPVGGLVLDNYKTDLPVKKGLSSSAAVCVLTARAFNLVYDLGLTVREEMELAYLGEIATPSRCGRMDQGCAFGPRPLLMRFDGDVMTVEPLQAGAPFHLAIVDLGGQKDTPRILADLNACYPEAHTETAVGVQQLLGPLNRETVQQAVAALQAGDAQRLGELMTLAQANFDRYAIPACPQELSAPRLHAVLTHPPLQPHVWGGKGVGSQGDGSAQFVARSTADRQIVADILQRDFGMHSLFLTIA